MNHSHGNKHAAGNRHTELMANASVSKAILTMSLPVILGMMVQVLYNLVDTFFIGLLKDENQTAAAGITTPILMLLMAIATIVSTGAASYMSRSIGQKDHETANKTLSTGAAICTGMGLVVMTLGILFIKPLIVGMGALPEVYPYAYQYGFVLLVGTVPVMLNYAGGQLLRAEGAMMPSITGMLIGTVVNVILDPIFIFVFKMGIQGAAIATVLGNVAGLVYYIYYYLSGKSLLKLGREYLSREGHIWKEIFGIGVPAALSQLLMSVATIILNNLAKEYGVTSQAGMSVSSKLMFIGSFIFMGFAAGCQPLIGFNYGARNYPRVHSIFKTGMVMTFGVGAFLTLMFWFMADLLVSVLTPLPNVISVGGSVLRISIFSFLVLGPQMLTTTGIQALGKAKEAMILSIARQGLFFIPLLFFMNRLAGFQGLIWAQPMSDTVTLALGIGLLVGILKKTVFAPMEQEE